MCYVLYLGHRATGWLTPSHQICFRLQVHITRAAIVSCTATPVAHGRKYRSTLKTRMPNVISIDDLDTQHIEYSGNWQVSTDGSSRQWESSTHTTTQPGASATFRFSGQAFLNSLERK